MPRGRHRHSPPLHRLLPPSAIAGVSVVCALGPWVFSEATVLRALAGAAAATAVVGAFVMRRWDIHAGKRVAELTRARAGDEWRYEERVAELETDLEESRELRTKLEQRLRAKRAELAGLRNEHASLLRRYATAETERASALEGRRLLEIEAAAPSPALPPARRAEDEPEPAVVKAAEEPAEAGAEAGADSGDEPTAYAVFSPEGARLYGQALTALARFDAEASGDSETDAPASVDTDTAAPAASEAASPHLAPKAAAPEAGAPGATETGTDAGAVPSGEADARKADAGGPPSAAQAEGAVDGNREDVAEGMPHGAAASASEAGAPAGQEDEAKGQPVAADGHTRAVAASLAPAEPAQPMCRPPAGHFTVPTAVAVVPAAPARRPVVEGGFDFFGTQKDAPKAPLDSVQNEDLADVVGQEALAVHKAESEVEFKHADARSDGVGQVIDLTAHDETEQIDVQGLRSAAS
ncbi:hypothetical protein SRB17_42690 [Streptomyces sp. RB17]|uniref:hypothetical protein n=1 Tax=Streptomyces sp. RB17 TaxID=2585197 RepID=UPI001309C36B|nr:hypothetical protein [Streptomyces sp. RB17]MQY36270.1 hypothetical protein [Streptomyces sp. RB17]